MKAISIAVLSIIFLQAMASSHSLYDIPMKKGEYATGGTSGEYPDKAEMEWLSKFEIVHAGNIEEPLLPDDISFLRANGVKVIMADDWLPAGYYYPEGNNTDFMKWVYDNRYVVTLNPDGPFPHCEEEGYDWQEYYFDFGVDELVTHRVNYIVNGLKNAGYNGIFFDWGNGLFLWENEYKSINATYNSRHPGVPYSQTAANFLNALREGMPDIVIENNQGFREPEFYLPVLDYDMTESYITDYGYYGKRLYVEGYGRIEVPQTVYYPVSENEFKGSIEDTIYYINYLQSLKKEYGGEHFKSFIYMNYAAPDFVMKGRENGHDVYVPAIPKNAIYFGYAMAKLVGEIEYTEVPWNHTYERCNVYFYDIGEPLGDNYTRVGNAFVRYYTNGFVVAGEFNGKTTINLQSEYIPSHKSVYDAFESKWIGSGEHSISITITPQIDELTGRMAPCGRVFVYGKSKINVSMDKPLPGRLYFMDREIMPISSSMAIIIGGITIEVETNGDRVEFYVDDALKYNDSAAPYSWLWNEFAIGSHEIKVVAYGEDGVAESRIEVFVINI